MVSFRRRKKKRAPAPPKPERVPVDDNRRHDEFGDFAAPIDDGARRAEDVIECAAAAAVAVVMAGLANEEAPAECAPRRGRHRGREELPADEWSAIDERGSHRGQRRGWEEPVPGPPADELGPACCGGDLVGELAGAVRDMRASCHDVLTSWVIRDHELHGLTAGLRNTRVVPRTRPVVPRVPLLKDHLICGERVVVYV